MTRDRFLYFAYGSNMLTARLRERCPSTEVVGPAALGRHLLIWHKKSYRDGSGKCGIEATGRAGDLVHGVVYSLLRNELQNLDAIEGVGKGYDAGLVDLDHGGRVLAAVKTYVPTMTEPGLRPFTWYKEYVVRGAREHGLPGDYVAALEAVASVEDPDTARRAMEAARLASFLGAGPAQR